ncbi:malate synthase [Shewanella schlegeliana]|uniref:Malate synthase n=1 Tax=Shewanella schlegeliana TaxID=190308 RepID=A0ABS1SZ45_9GAMM|nr:malate synthase [Shewanella schlegeliana]MBL4913816.1 malate synthase [Shewanella schlegeliana]MCL1108799.1 malate synthase [Shewanella schlegeliana]GIU25978.1 malate synthase [Shewanella schlegeliana]
MDISTINSTQVNQNNNFIGAELVDVDLVKVATSCDTTAPCAKTFLDAKFPLAKGSHKNACSYVVYYSQLLIFMADGSQTGLRFPKQFVALTGHKSEPSAILLRDRGTHVELSFDRKQPNRGQDLANIKDIQLQGHDYWISLINIENTATVTAIQEREFTAKDGSEYLVKNQY